ncbi:MAG TPA: hypothetical protein VMU99_02230 [Acidimicrobiales bacterium]|nr:hypothetical protein [Acidimicrobiales bacterium]
MAVVSRIRPSHATAVVQFDGVAVGLAGSGITGVGITGMAVRGGLGYAVSACATVFRISAGRFMAASGKRR